MKDALQDYMGRPKRYDNIDGTGEMAFGLMMLGFTLLGYLQTVLPKDSMWGHGFAGMLFSYAVLLSTIGLMLWGSKAIKKRITWPRTGYVKYGIAEKSPRTWRALWTGKAAIVVFSGAIAAVIAAGVVCLMRFDRRHDWISLIWTGYATLFVMLYAFWIYCMERNHPWKWLVLLFMVLGLLAIALVARGDIVGARWLMLLFVDLTWLASGGVTLYLYMRRTQPPTPDAE